MSKHIILIDDDQDDGEIFSDALDELQGQFTLRHFDDGETALETLRNPPPDRVDIIFLDINMPKIDGWQCLRAIKDIGHLKNIPIVMYSTSSFAVEKLAPEEVGAAAFMTKPDNFEELKERLKALFGRFLH